ncbi:hypothetical protein ACJX0J_032460, partial [Zea mays]
NAPIFSVFHMLASTLLNFEIGENYYIKQLPYLTSNTKDELVKQLVLFLEKVELLWDEIDV